MIKHIKEITRFLKILKNINKKLNKKDQKVVNSAINKLNIKIKE